MENFKSSGTFTKQAHVDIPDGLYEEEHGRKGFFGRVAHLYHENPPVGWGHIEGQLRPRALRPLFEQNHHFVPLLSNRALQISVGQVFPGPGRPFQRNADFDELYFVHKGLGRVETIYGPLELVTGDYLSLPRGTTYKFYPSQGALSLLKLESDSEFEQPNRGPLGPNALYDQSAIVAPQCAKGTEVAQEYVVEIQRGGITRVTYPFNPLDAVGWKGSLYPFKLSIYDICPIMSHRYHIPPSGHTTFVAQHFVVCSFVARPLEDSAHKVLKVPFYHSNIDFDEVIFYHEGSFFSRDNIEASSMTFHPRGIHHGPHPKAFKRAHDKSHTDEFAVMIDARFPLERSELFGGLEIEDYWKSWQ